MQLLLEILSLLLRSPGQMMMMVRADVLWPKVLLACCRSPLVCRRNQQEGQRQNPWLLLPLLLLLLPLLACLCLQLVLLGLSQPLRVQPWRRLAAWQLEPSIAQHSEETRGRHQ